MSNALACFCCEKSLKRVIPPEQGGSELQPYAGTSFDSQGHYGSTVFDPFLSGDTIHVNLCDECIRDRAAKGLVLTNVANLPMKDDRGVIVGRHWVHRAYVPWTPEMEYNDEVIEVEPEEVGDPDLGRSVEWTPEAREEWANRVKQS